MSRGGQRPGAGRRGRWGERTTRVRIPASLAGQVEDFLIAGGFKIPLYPACVPINQTQAIPDDGATHFDFNKFLINHADKFCFLVSGNSMIEAGIGDGDILIVDRKQKPASGKIVVARIDDMVVVKRFKKSGKAVALVPENDNHLSIKVKKSRPFEIIGVVTGSIRQH